MKLLTAAKGAKTAGTYLYPVLGEQVGAVTPLLQSAPCGFAALGGTLAPWS
jgi:hypothetical protein